MSAPAVRRACCCSRTPLRKKLFTACARTNAKELAKALFTGANGEVFTRLTDVLAPCRSHEAGFKNCHTLSRATGRAIVDRLPVTAKHSEPVDHKDWEPINDEVKHSARVEPARESIDIRALPKIVSELRKPPFSLDFSYA